MGQVVHRRGRMPDWDPPDEIPSTWHSIFNTRFSECASSRLREFREEEESEYRDALQRGIRKDKHHRQLLNLCIFPFVEHQLLGYEFIRADPLTELGCPNFDFLLFDFQRGRAIFGEVKANIGPGWESEQFDRFIEKREAALANQEYIKREYLGREIRSLEFVFGVFAPDADRVTQQIVSEGESIVTWCVHQMNKRITINTPAPSRGDWPDDPDEYLDMITHNHNRLNSEIETVQSASECFDLFPESHPVTELRALITALHKDSGMCFVNRLNLLETVSDSLFYLSSEQETEVTDSIIESAFEIGFLRDWDGEEGEYKIKSVYAHSDGLEETLESKWIDSMVEKKEREIRATCYGDVTQQILDETGEQTELTDFI